MKTRLKALSDEDLRWNPRIESWWNSGGALLWNRFGGMGTDELVLTEEEYSAFIEEAATLPGWEPGPGEDVDSRPFFINDNEDNPPFLSPQNNCPGDAVTVGTVCCRNCGRKIHPGMVGASLEGSVSVSARDLNHLLNSMEEALMFIRGEGPNNSKTWEAALGEFLASLSRFNR